MTLATTTTIKTLGDCAYQAIEKHFKKTIKWEKSVKKDEDPEAVHQMRVGMRRLRTAVSRFERYLSLPKSVSDKNIGKLARILGSLRDLDVLEEILEKNYKPHLVEREQEFLQTAITALHKEREAAFSHVQKTFKDEIYKSLKNKCEDWLKNPSYQTFSSVPIHHVLPDLLSPEVSEFCLHPGWLIGTKIVKSEIVVQTKWTPTQLEEHLKIEGETLHSLRKQAKRLRYQMELFTELYGESFAAQINDVKNIQEILGMIQDNMVLHEWLENIFKSELDNQLQGLTTLLAANRYQLWQEWQPLQQRYLQAEARYNLHLAVLQPTVSDNEAKETKD
ncbi:CHAD domain-containing protein [Anabaena cylindrica FACHB-243]|uniref:CHAD domain containing protein n=1 Tax=Anabaena cylindrica (strain ATCC 27899 / PCC 7122) TaxID=272123 RepID=K9ZKN1_ANACC|nr:MULTISPECIES: CHAD domain-containing protein [Anabaena]AFZ59117.1 CHAD domain containing protein [Anabaena cylindrica PCC 7122]MBD2419222.1 CHAD domain-containing protein [Anabaena cylindrica FACHB-243]MBY5283553.1 CHAD domain-containing protein [Anabaena sp. CCAP 1446/1C]MBY5308901.1 CHAD domain-containing protein [Anabaena sp. CCAP 1446/1C]MCM2409903.1 CHAD domain-containing protein [Anabaena sp. CCAP 1446/1C]